LIHILNLKIVWEHDMKIECVISTDGAKIAYSFTDSDNNKEGLLLMHGSGQRKEIWEQFGWIEALNTNM